MLAHLRKREHEEDREETLKDMLVSNILSLLKIFMVCFVLVFLTANYVVRPFRVSGDSMVPTLSQKEFGITNAFKAKFLDIHYGDIVIAYEKTTFHDYIVKRVIALPGDTVYCKKETIYVNDEAIYEPYLDNDFVQNILATDTSLEFNSDFDAVTLGEDEYWLMGDNRINSTDSRMFGPVKRNQIKGVGLTVIMPFDKIRTAK